MSELLERESFVHELETMLKDALAGQGRVALVSGEAGIGKTALVEHFTRQHHDSVRVLWGTCDSLFTPRPLGPLHDIAMEVEGKLSALLISNGDRQAIFSTCLNELKTQKTILVIEDVHWADEATLDLLKYLGRRIRQTKSLMMLTYRDDEISADHPLRILLGDLASSHTLHRIPVSPLSRDAVHELAKNKKVDSVALHRLTNGNPFFVTEVLAVESGIPETVRDAVLARAARLSPSARNVLEAAAVIGSRTEAWLLSNIVGAESVYVEECISKGMLQAQGEHYSFRHELTRQTILESISKQRKVNLYRITLETFKESSEMRNEYARLADYAEGTKDSKAILEFVPAAARQASALGAHRQSYAHYRKAVQFAKMLPPEKRAEMFDSFASECESIAQTTEAEQAQQESLRLWRKLGQTENEGRALRRLSEIVMRQNKSSEMKHYASEAVAVLEKVPSSKELAIAYSHKSRMHMIAYEVEGTYQWGKRAIEVAERIGDIETSIHAYTNMGIMEMWHNQTIAGQKKLEHSLNLSMEHGYHNHAARAFDNLVDGLLVAYDYVTGLKYLNEGLNYCYNHDLDLWYFRLLIHRVHAKFDQGRWADAELDIHASREITESTDINAAMNLCELKLMVRRGDPLDPEEINKLREFTHAAIFQDVTYPIAAILAEMAWLRGDLIQCRAEAESFYQDACRLKIPSFMGRLGYWMWRAGAIAKPSPNTAEPYATHIAGNWRDAASMWEKFGCPYEQGLALMDGDQAAQRRALEIFETLGARPIIEKLKGQMRAQGIPIPRGPRPATRGNPYGLTAREVEVLASLVEGLSNNAIAKKLSLSNRTVEHHIASILQKMQVHSRNEAVVLALKTHLLPFD